MRSCLSRPSCLRPAHTSLDIVLVEIQLISTILAKVYPAFLSQIYQCHIVGTLFQLEASRVLGELCTTGLPTWPLLFWDKSHSVAQASHGDGNSCLSLPNNWDYITAGWCALFNAMSIVFILSFCTLTLWPRLESPSPCLALWEFTTKNLARVTVCGCPLQWEQKKLLPELFLQNAWIILPT